MKIDFAAINAAALPCYESLCREILPEGNRSGHEWECRCVFHAEKTPSLKISLTKGMWQCFGCGKSGGDPISLYAEVLGVKQSEAAEALARRFLGTDGRPFASATPMPKPDGRLEWSPVVPAPANAPSPSFRHHRFGQASRTWEYRDAQGQTIGHICRFDLPEGGKDVVPRVYCQHADGRREWRWLSFPKPRPLYGLDLLAANQSAGVIIVEGEKAADAARTICPGVVITWPGGGKAVKHTDWSPLMGRKVIIWPDRDAPGMEAAQAIASKVHDLSVSLRIITPPDGPEDGWDAADAVADGWTSADVRELLKRPEPKPEPTHEEPPQGWDQHHEGYNLAPPPEESSDDRVMDLPFRLLGVEGDQFFYMPDRGQQIVSLSASGHTKNNLMRLAPLQLWEGAFGSKSGCDWDASNNALIQRSQNMPKFDPRRIRGRGCWIDGNDVVFHAGNQLVVNGEERNISSYNSHVRAIYEGALEIPVDSDEIASNRDAAKLIELCELLSWERPLYGKLLAGWLALAPVCGALPWRPHLWVTGPSGSGKSWTVANIIHPVVGRTSVSVQGNTSEAGIRGMLGSDALPVIFDEAESEDRASQLRFDKVLELARQASTETGAGIVKGTATGGAVTYLVRSSFLFASIGVAAVKKADVSRITVLPLKKNVGKQAADHFEKVKALWKQTTAQEGYCSRLRARSIQFAKVIRANIETFTSVAVEFTGDKRSADQIGTLLAGAFSLTSTKEIAPAAAHSWMDSQDWSGFKSEESENDENQCYSHLFGSQIRFELQGQNVSRSISESVEEVMHTDAYASEDKLRRKAEIKAALIRHGVKIHDGRIYVANHHQALDKMFADTPWGSGKWRQQLERVDGSKKEPVQAFGSHVRQRCVSMPL